MMIYRYVYLSAIAILSASYLQKVPPHFFNIRPDQMNLFIDGRDCQEYEVRYLDNETFMSVSQLRLLHLYNIGISVIKDGTFQWLSNLDDLSLVGNRLNNITSSQFVGLNNRHQLNLGRNRITHIGKGTFVTLPALIVLQLDNNRITFIHQLAFLGLRCLHILYLDGNQLMIMQKSHKNITNVSQAHAKTFDGILQSMDSEE